MTLIVCIKFEKGVVLATDSREVFGAGEPLMRESQRKIEILNEKYCLVGAGMVGAIERVLEDIREQFNRSKIDGMRAFVDLCEDSVFRYFKRYRERLEYSEEQEDVGLSLVAASKDKLFIIHEDGTSEQEPDYICEGSSFLYGEYILRQLYKPGLSIDQSAQLAIYVIKQASNMDPNVGGPINVVYITDKGVKQLSEDEVKKLENKVSGQSIEFQRDLFGLVDQIIDLRRNINQKTKQAFGFELFRQQEVAIWSIAHPAITEEDFTNRILALGILIDEMNVPHPNRGDQAKKLQGSIDLLESWLKGKYCQSEKEIQSLINDLRDIRILRSKSFPVHPDDAKFVAVVVNWGLTFPPDWSKLYLQTINKYADALRHLMNLLAQ